MPRMTRILALLLCSVLVALPALADGITIPRDTPVYAELEERVTSRKRETATGDVVSARVWRDVVVDGQVVIEEGAEVVLKVGYVKKARFLGRKGHLILEAVSVEAIDGSTIALDGEQYRSGKGRKAATSALTFAVAWPFLFVRGKNARADAGTVLQTYVDHDVTIARGYASQDDVRATQP